MMTKSIDELLERAGLLLENGDEANEAYSMLAIAQAISKWVNENIPEPVEEPCQCKSDEPACPTCLGAGEVMAKPGAYPQLYEICHTCHGSGLTLVDNTLAAAAPELLRLVREIAWGGEILPWICPWCHKDTSHYQKHAPDCPAAAILKRFEDR
jgi:hypothetical protein